MGKLRDTLRDKLRSRQQQRFATPSGKMQAIRLRPVRLAKTVIRRIALPNLKNIEFIGIPEPQ